MNLREEHAAKTQIHEQETEQAVTFAHKVEQLAKNLEKILPEGQEAAAVSRDDVEVMTEEAINEVKFQCDASNAMLAKPMLGASSAWSGLVPETSLQSISAQKIRCFCRQTRLDGEMKEMQGTVDIKAIDDFAEKDRDYQKRLGELETVTKDRDAVRSKHDDLRKRRLDEFMQGFLTISLKLKEMYQMITLGGDAELELVDTLDPFSEVKAHHELRQRGLLVLVVVMLHSCYALFVRWIRHMRSHVAACALSKQVICAGHRVQRAAAKEELEKHCQPEWRRENAKQPLACVCTAPLQADTAVLHGRD